MIVVNRFYSLGGWKLLSLPTFIPASSLRIVFKLAVKIAGNNYDRTLFVVEQQLAIQVTLLFLCQLCPGKSLFGTATVSSSAICKWQASQQ